MCKLCHEYGHQAKTCPEGKTEFEKVKIGDDGAFGGAGDIATLVKEKRAAGMNSIQVAQSLKIKLSEVNKYW